jgi:hypothetical protein
MPEMAPFRNRAPASAAPARRLPKAVAWGFLGLVLWAARIAARLLGRTRRVDLVVYKVDRLGDWLLAEPTIARLVADVRGRGGSVVVWVGEESAALRQWRQPDFEVEEFALEPRSRAAKVRRALAVVRLLAVYRARTFVCLRHSPDPIRDFVLSHVRADGIYAMSRCVGKGPPAEVPYEIGRHFAILAAAGLEPRTARELLPRIARTEPLRGKRVVLAPFSSAAIKDWSDEAWNELIGGMACRDYEFELWVGADQVDRAERLIRRMGEWLVTAPLAVRSGSLGDLAKAVESAALVVAVDTFTAHLAIAMDSPAICLIGGGHFGDFGPWQNSAQQRWISNALPCFGCNWRCTRSRVECMDDIRASDVLSGIDAILESEPPRRIGTRP